MKDNQLKQLLNLIRRTGERCFVADNETEEVFALMTLSDYEKLLNNEVGRDIAKLSEEEMMNKINRDVAYWRSAQPLDESVEVELKKEIKPAIQPKIIKAAAGNMVALGDVLKNKEYFSEKNEEIIENKEPKLVEKSKTEESVPAGFGVEESLTDLPEDGGEEEKFYLEPIE
ncbi:MAG: hypothetical protein COU29_01635 [Candidatus Magasanikbacteria bacterium CG10_big_fil_rev_8_21_14_0_10_36_32]|uniref:Uncharacterized protein n=1 Tax=Candidatus Magasanikbacteria bacterium CG10_big_fil_rev_8_21_14_0_10_36_32 TaxID=1974646 RepID=A0A2M6W6U3_9BACT|nr:MAG: hypothetical protein COU29_01635 [Candidatus Magasanikbacteria bacterium CG10_big_fil_rev_8_21_14_0_10_36_32]